MALQYQALAGHHDFAIYDDESGRDVALVRNFDEAKARLFAAAPDGHEVLLAIHEYFRHWNPIHPAALLNDDGLTFKVAVAEYVAKAKGGA